MANTDIVLNGLYHLKGATVTVTIGGLDCGDYTVAANGTVTVPINSDPDGLCNGAYLRTLDVGPWDRTTYGDLTTQLTIDADGAGQITIYVPVAIGYCYTSAGQVLRPASPETTKSQQGPGTGKTRRVHNYAILGYYVGGKNALTIGTNFNEMHAVPTTTNGGVTMPHNTVFGGVTYGAITDTDSYEGQLCWQMVRPYPCTINSLNAFIEVQEH